MLVGAAVLGLALGLVALDSATYVQRSRTLFGLPPETAADHLGYLHLFWGAPLVLLAVQAGHAWVTAGGQADREPRSLDDELRSVLRAAGVLAGFALVAALVCGLVGATILSATAPSCDPSTEIGCGLEGPAGFLLGGGIGLLLGLLAGSVYLLTRGRRN